MLQIRRAFDEEKDCNIDRWTCNRKQKPLQITLLPTLILGELSEALPVQVDIEATDDSTRDRRGAKASNPNSWHWR